MADCYLSVADGKEDKTRSRTWRFTIDNYTNVPASLTAGMRYLIVGEEVTPDGTARLRGYVVFQNPKMLPHKHFLEYGHGTFSVAIGNRDENVEHCKKGGNYYEFEGHKKDPKMKRHHGKRAQEDPDKDPKMQGHHGKSEREDRNRDPKMQGHHGKRAQEEPNKDPKMQGHHGKRAQEDPNKDPKKQGHHGKREQEDPNRDPKMQGHHGKREQEDPDRDPKKQGHHGRVGGQTEQDEWERCWQLARRGKFEEIPPAKRIKHLSTWLMVQSKFGVKLDCIGKLNNLWIHGPAGSGKSRWVNLTYPHCYRKLNSKWWDGYSVDDPDHKVVLCEDLHPDTWDVLPQLKVWADHYPFIAETKGSSLTIRPENIVVTSNYTPEQCFARREDVIAIRRRFSVLTVEHLPAPGTRQEAHPDSSQEETRAEHAQMGLTDGETSQVGNNKCKTCSSYHSAGGR